MTQNIEEINRRFRQLGQITVKFRWYIIATLILLNLFAMRGIQKIQFESSNENWFFEDDPLTIATEEFEESFGNNDYVAIWVEADDVFAPDILRVIRELGEELEERIPFADNVTSLTDFEFTRGTEDEVEIIDIVPETIPTTFAAIEEIRRLAFSKDYLVNRLFSDDSTQAWILLRLRPYSDDWKTSAEESPQILVGQQVLELLEQEKYSRYTLKATGTPVIAYEERVFFSSEATRTMIIACGVAILLLFLFLGTFRGIVVPMLTAISSILWVFGAMGYLGIKVDTMIMTIPIYLGMAVSVGYSIHLFNFFRKSFFEGTPRKDSVGYAVGETGWPMFFTAATTISALLSFYVVPIRQVRWMGLSAAAVVFATYILVMTLTPTLLSFGKKRVTSSRYRVNLDRWFAPLWTQLSVLVQRRKKRILIIFLLLVLVFLGGLTRVYVSMHHEKTLGIKIPYIKTMHDIGQTPIGSMDSYNLTISFDQPAKVKDPEILHKFESLISEITQFRLVKRVSSLLDVLKDMNQILHGDDPEFFRIPETTEFVAQLLLLYEIADGTELENWADYDYTTLRLMVDVDEIDTGEVEREFRYLQTKAKELFPDAKFGMVGGLVQTSVVQTYIAKGEIASFLLALIVIGVLMMLVFRSVRTGLIGMIPNIAPVIVVGGLMGYLDIPLEMTTMMIIPMLLGLAVDDTIHFMNHSKLEFQRTGDYQKSIENTFQSVGKAIFMTSFILSSTFLVYTTSIAKFFFNLGILAIAGVSSALLADYFITPILIQWTKPFGDEQQHTIHGLEGSENDRNYFTHP